MSILMDVGERIRAIRVSKGMTQTELAEESDSCVSHISNIENGKSEMGLEMLSRIVHALGVRADTLLPNEELEQKDILADAQIDFFIDEYDKKYKNIVADCTKEEKYILIEMLRLNKKHVREYEEMLKHPTKSERKSEE